MMTSMMGNRFIHHQHHHKTYQPTTMIRYPLNHSLEEELNRLFADFTVSHVSPNNSPTNPIWEDFRHNGADYEYCPDSNDPTEKYVRAKKRKTNKPLPTECVFCKNNGEEAKIYKNHLLKDEDNNIVCPILSNYKCTICGATGTKAHTIKYCPFNKDPSHYASMNVIKSMRNSTGRRRSSRG